MCHVIKYLSQASSLVQAYWLSRSWIIVFWKMVGRMIIIIQYLIKGNLLNLFSGAYLFFGFLLEEVYML